MSEMMASSPGASPPHDFEVIEARKPNSHGRPHGAVARTTNTCCAPSPVANGPRLMRTTRGLRAVTMQHVDAQVRRSSGLDGSSSATCT